MFFDAVSNPVLSGCFIISAALLSGRSLKQALIEYKKKFWDILTVDTLYWPLANYLNFKYLPFKYRIIYINMVTLVYSVIMAHIRKMKPLEAGEMETTTDESRSEK